MRRTNRKTIRLAAALLTALILPLAISWAQNQTQFILEHDVTVNQPPFDHPFCSATLTADCISYARIFTFDGQGGEVDVYAKIPPAEFQIVSGTLWRTVKTIPPTAKRYEMRLYCSQLAAVDADGQEVRGATKCQNLVRRPPPPADFRLQ